MATLGQKLRELRHQKDYKLNEVAAGADLSISFISLIERDKASISVENLQKLANFYHVRLFQIFQDIEEEDAYVVLDQQINALRALGSPTKPTLFLISPEDNLSFRAILARIPPALQEETIRLQKGEVFILVKEGQVDVSLRNNKSMTLNQGDSAHLTSFKGTVLSNNNHDLPVTLLIVASASTQHLDKQGDLLTYHEIKP